MILIKYSIFNIFTQIELTTKTFIFLGNKQIIFVNLYKQTFVKLIQKVV